jgi:hypothetical protein
MKTKRNKIYLITDSNNAPRAFGSQNRIAWRTERHLLYHLTKKWNRTENCSVVEIDLTTGAIISQSVVSFVENHRNPDAIRETIAKEFGFVGIDLSGLESLYRLNALEHSMHERVGNFLVARGIVGITENALRTAAKRLS